MLHSRMVGVLACLAVLLTGLAAPAFAKPPSKPGPVSGLTLSVTKPGAAYHVTADWDTAKNATRYRARLSVGGTTVDSDWVTRTSWTGQAAAAAGTKVKVTITSYNGKRRGSSTSASTVLPDLTAPLARYSIVRHNGSGGDVSLHLDELSDDVSARNDIVQYVDWGEGEAAVNWPAPFSDLQNIYENPDPKVYDLAVTVQDQAGNKRVYPLVVVVNDTEAPTGSYALSQSTAWAGWTKVELVQQTLTDHGVSAPENVTRVVDWGDGTAPAVWATGTAARHVYAKAGAFSPTVKLTDQAGNSSAALPAGTATVTADTFKPKVTIKTKKPRKSVRAWRKLTGKASDFGTGVRVVKVKVVEKRRGGWYAYRPAKKVWFKAGTTRGAAVRKAPLAKVRPTATSTWSLKVARLTKGVLYVKASAVDNRLNASRWVDHRQRLTRR